MIERQNFHRAIKRLSPRHTLYNRTREQRILLTEMKEIAALFLNIYIDLLVIHSTRGWLIFSFSPVTINISRKHLLNARFQQQETNLTAAHLSSHRTSA
jgi:hypothetical protein